ncbi:hypothetical protein LCGC14_2539280, partial [marine sediment metagenome]
GFNVYGAKSNEDAVKKIKQYLDHQGIPYTRIFGVIDYHFRDGQHYASMEYEPKLTEARYYRRSEPKEIVKRLNKLSYETVKEAIYVADTWVINGKVWARFYVYGFENEGGVKQAVKQFLDHHGIPYSIIDDIVTMTGGHSVSMIYDPQRLTEAKYYGRPPLKKIIKRTKGLINSTRGGKVWLNDTWISSDHGAKQLHARFVVRGFRTEEQVYDVVQQFLDHHNIPHTEIYGIVRDNAYSNVTNPRWIATMRYKPKHQDERYTRVIARAEEVTEAKYYGKHSVKDVSDRYNKIGKKYNAVENVRIMSAGIFANDTAYANVYVVYADSKHKAISHIEQFLEKYGLPHTEIRDTSWLHDAWEATVVYHPDRVTEAKYYGKHTGDAVVKRLKKMAKTISKSESDVTVEDVWQVRNTAY